MIEYNTLNTTHRKVLKIMILDVQSKENLASDLLTNYFCAKIAFKELNETVYKRNKGEEPCQKTLSIIPCKIIRGFKCLLNVSYRK